MIDEAQHLFAHPGHGKTAAADAEFVIKIGPAFGAVLVIATQRPDKASLPTGWPQPIRRSTDTLGLVKHAVSLLRRRHGCDHACRGNHRHLGQYRG